MREPRNGDEHKRMRQRVGDVKAVFGSARAADTIHNKNYEEENRRKPAPLPTSLDELKSKLDYVMGVKPPTYEFE